MKYNEILKWQKIPRDNPVMSNVMSSAKFILRKCMWLHNKSIYITENLFDLKFPFLPKNG